MFNPIEPIRAVEYRPPDQHNVQRVLAQVDHGSKKFIRFKQIMYLIVASTCVATCIFYLKPTVMNYYEYPTQVDVRVEILRSIRNVLPGLTVCHNSLIALKDLEKLDKTLKKKISEVEKQAINEDERYVAKLKLINSSINEFVTSKPLTEQMQLKLINSEGFITELDCDRTTWKADRSTRFYDIRETCSNVHKVRSIQGHRMCFTLFSEVALVAMDNTQVVPAGKFPAHGRWGLDSIVSMDKEQMAAMLGSNYEPPIFSTNGLFNAKVNFNVYSPKRNESTNLMFPIGGKLMVHSSRFMPSSVVGGVYIRPGKKYTLYIKRTRTWNMAPPYQTNCRNYSGEYENARIAMNFTMDLNVPISREACTDICIGKSAAKHCGCWPMALPFYKDNQTEAMANIRHCSVLDGEKCINEHYLNCSSQCPTDCLDEGYDLSLLETDYPDPRALEYLRQTNDAKKFKRMYNPFESLIEVIYETTEETNNYHEPVSTGETLLLEIAGLVGLFTSWGVISLIDLCELIYAKLAKKTRKH